MTMEMSTFPSAQVSAVLASFVRTLPLRSIWASEIVVVVSMELVSGVEVSRLSRC